MNKPTIVDHLFRHQHGKMVAVLTRLFGLSNLELIEDAIQDIFIKAVKTWPMQMPDNPPGWLMAAAKNRAIDLLRKEKTSQTHLDKFNTGPASYQMGELFLEHELEDAQLSMIFTACHPILNPHDQIAFALKTISGFGTNEIASALLLKNETVKKRLARARKTIATENIEFKIPNAADLPQRMQRVLEVIYLTFNEGFHSNNKKLLIRSDLCSEALRLCQLLIKNEKTRSPECYALFSLICFHTARLASKVDDDGNIIDLQYQDRSKWDPELIVLGNLMMAKAIDTDHFSNYHFEASIIAEHIKATSFATTNWEQILIYYDAIYAMQPSDFILMSKSIVLLQLGKSKEAGQILNQIDPKTLEHRAYLYYGTLSEYYGKTGEFDKAIETINQAIDLVTNTSEKEYLSRKKEKLVVQQSNRK